jgi:hypothetical protein
MLRRFFGAMSLPSKHLQMWVSHPLHVDVIHIPEALVFGWRLVLSANLLALLF